MRSSPRAATLGCMRPSRLLTVLGGYPFAVASVGIVTAVLLPFRSVLDPAQVMLLYVPLLVWIGRTTGVRTSIVSALLSFLAVDLLFIPPYYHLTVTSPVDWVTLVMFLGVALVAGVQTGRMRRREHAALQRQREIALLNRLASRLVTEKSVEAMASSLVHDVVAVLGAERAALYTRGDGDRAQLLADAGAAAADISERALADWVIRQNKAVALAGVEELAHDQIPVTVAADAAVPGVVADGSFVPLQTTGGLEGVLYARPLSGARTGADESRQLVAVANLAAIFLGRQRLEQAAAHASALRESDRLKATLVSSVSHELKTPLAAVTARITGLLEEPDQQMSDRVRAELTAASEDLSRLDSSIRDLVDVSRLESDAWRPKLDVYGIGEILGTVASRVSVSNRSRVSFEVPEGLPPVRVDFGQIARAVSNLVDNALSYSPKERPVRVGARMLGDELIVWVEDEGPGVPEAEKGQVFEKFYRGSTSVVSPSGTGLGLAIVREIVKSNGGRVWVEDVSPSGARFVVSLPVGGRS